MDPEGRPAGTCDNTFLGGRCANDKVPQVRCGKVMKCVGVRCGEGLRKRKKKEGLVF